MHSQHFQFLTYLRQETPQEPVELRALWLFTATYENAVSGQILYIIALASQFSYLRSFEGDGEGAGEVRRVLKSC